MVSVINAMQCDGMIQEAEVEELFRAAKYAELGIVEIGCYRGRSAVALAAGALAGERAPVFCIDPFDFYVAQGVSGPYRYGPENREHFLRNIERAGVAEQITHLHKTAVEAAKGWKRKIDLLWIDGNHQYDAVSADFAAWDKFVVVGGLVYLHDNDEPGVVRLMQEILQTKKYVRIEPDVKLMIRLRKVAK